LHDTWVPPSSPPRRVSRASNRSGWPLWCRRHRPACEIRGWTASNRGPSNRWQRPSTANRNETAASWRVCDGETTAGNYDCDRGGGDGDRRMSTSPRRGSSRWPRGASDIQRRSIAIGTEPTRCNIAGVDRTLRHEYCEVVEQIRNAHNTANPKVPIEKTSRLFEWA